MFIVPISLSLAISFYVYELYLGEKIFEFIWSLFLNIFAGSSVLLVTTTIEYKKNRKDVLEKLYLEYHKFFALLLNINPIDSNNQSLKEIKKYYELGCESTKDLDWNFGQLALFKKEKKLDKICREKYKFLRDLMKKFYRFRIEYEHISDGNHINAENAIFLEIAVKLLRDLQNELFTKKEKVEDGCKIIYYKSTFLSDLDKDLTIMLDKTNRTKFSIEERQKRYQPNKKLDYKGIRRIKLD